MSAPSALTAVILAGGRSSRMGTDKALLRLPSGGPTLIARVVAAAQAVVAEIVIVADDAARLPALPAHIVPDALPGAGPLAGLVAGFAAARHADILALACDLPYLSVPLLRWMAAQPRTWDALVPRLPDADGKEGWQPLHALYTRACDAPMRAALDAGERQLIACFAAIRVQPLTLDAMRPHDPDLHSTRGVNTPGAWMEAARWLAAREETIIPAVTDATDATDGPERTK